MKTNNIIISILSVSLIFSLGCKKLTEERNIEPNNFTDADASLMIVGMALGDVLAHEDDLARTAGIWSGQLTGADRQYVALNNYTTTSGDYDNSWGVLYSECVQQSRIIQEKADVLNNKPMKGVAQIFEAHSIGTATSIWGDVPFSEAADVVQFPQPKYDPQLEVYTSLQTLLDEAIANVGGTGSIPANLNEVTAPASWTEVAYSLKARYYLHTGNYAAAIAAANQGIASGNDWVIEHPADYSYGDEGRWNTFYSFLDWWRAGYMTADDAYLAEILDPASTKYSGDTLSDESARFDFYYITPASAPWGYTYGSKYDPNYQSGIFDIAAPYTMFSYVENQLILAECYALNDDLPTALAHLNNARADNDAKFGGGLYLPLTLGMFAAGEHFNTTNMTNKDALLMEIRREKYISMFSSIEVWNDLKRTDNAIGVPVKGGATKIPERFPYAQVEINSNTNTPANVDIYTPTEVNK